MRAVVSDAGPLIHLGEAHALGLLPLAGEVRVPPAIPREVARHLDDWRAGQPDWLKLEPLTEAEARQAAAWLQAGLLDAREAEAIALAQRFPADWFLTDDAAARIFAEALGLEAHGSLGVVLWAAAERHVNHGEASMMLDALAASSLWLSRRVLNEARAALDRLASPAGRGTPSP